MARLAQLLKRFHLPTKCTSAELRKAYYREAKKLHPDHNPSSCGAQAFAQLRADFEEAQKLLEQPRSGFAKSAGDFPDFSFEDGKRWSAAAWAARSQAPPGFRGFREEDSSARPEPSVPVVGLPSEVVYTFTAVISAAVVLGFLYHLSQVFTADGQPEVTVAAHAAHRAAAGNEVSWLENCGADKACRPLLFAGDERDDTPLHHGARAGRTEACAALIRLGADPSRLNRFGLAPEHLASQLGHKDTAFVLRSVRAARQGAAGAATQAAAKRAMRHPDDLGHLKDPREALSEVAAESLRRAARMSGDPERALPMLRECEPSMQLVVRKREWIESWAHGSHTGQPGLLLYEGPGSRTDGHWVALIRNEESGILRLDPIRGTFFLTGTEASELAARYPIWSLEPAVSGE
ncbi:unnamed protein product, partial [Symbiodinium pilosum]